MLACPGIGFFPAFSGMPKDRNLPSAVANSSSGPLPPGRYFIVDRQSGGHLGWLYDFVRTHVYGTDRSHWFALYRNDGEIDDETFIYGVRRGAFRLHPIGPSRRSEGCITMVNHADFRKLSSALRNGGANLAVPGGRLKVWNSGCSIMKWIRRCTNVSLAIAIGLVSGVWLDGQPYELPLLPASIAEIMRWLGADVAKNSDDVENIGLMVICLVSITASAGMVWLVNFAIDRLLRSHRKGDHRRNGA